MSPSSSSPREWSPSSGPSWQNSLGPKQMPFPLSPTAWKSPPTDPGELSSETSHVPSPLPPLSLWSATAFAQRVLQFCHLCRKLTTDFGHDKSRAIKPYAALPADHRPIMVYCGDGVSDISAARETDLLFAKKGRDLVTHCLKENVPFYPFDVPPNSSIPLLPSTVLFYYRSVLLCALLHLFYFGFVLWG